jgi:5-methyltetrahydropteroyltriglutamate--homocysteine methyltransferase
MKTANLGYPRIGAERELKKAVEAYWKGRSSAADLANVAADLRHRAWRTQAECGIDIIPSNDFSFYDQVLDATAMVGAVPARFGKLDGQVDIDTYFAMARGSKVAPAMEMTKWFDTNYHYIVPELEPGQSFRLASTKPIDEFLEAKKLGYSTRPVLIGPVTYLLLAKSTDPAASPLALLPKLLPVYEEVLERLQAAGADWVQIDEPALACDLPEGASAAFATAFGRLGALEPKLMLTTYFGALGDNLSLAAALPVAGLHVDLVRGRYTLGQVLEKWPKDRWLSLGLVEGRNIWRSDLDAAFALLERARAEHAPERLLVAPSCSLLHVPLDLGLESELDPELKSWLAFARQKLEEVALLGRTAREGSGAVAEAWQTARDARETRRKSPRVRREAVRAQSDRSAAEKLDARQSPFSARREKQRALLNLPAFPTTTIGSFPQTAEIRTARADHRAGRLSRAEYEKFLEREIAAAIDAQEAVGLDVFVHGEPERNDMVEYFGEQLAGFLFTAHGWVQSYGSRCVKPPIIFGDVERTSPMTVRWSQFAQSLSKRPVKGMLTGPVTILQWSFVRDDQPRAETCRQIAFALRGETCDLEQAGIRVIQIDEPALREGLPLRRGDWAEYLRWAAECFRISSSGVADETQIHTHMCYAQFDDILPAIAALDADVISLEASRSRMELLASFRDHDYPNEIGPGVYDIHSPRVPTAQEMAGQLRAACAVLPPDHLWVNPDCGLKTRDWPEVLESLRNMVSAARSLRDEYVVSP